MLETARSGHHKNLAVQTKRSSRKAIGAATKKHMCNLRLGLLFRKIAKPSPNGVVSFRTRNVLIIQRDRSPQHSRNEFLWFKSATTWGGDCIYTVVKQSCNIPPRNCQTHLNTSHYAQKNIFFMFFPRFSSSGSILLCPLLLATWFCWVKGHLRNHSSIYLSIIFFPPKKCSHNDGNPSPAARWPCGLPRQWRVPPVLASARAEKRWCRHDWGVPRVEPRLDVWSRW